MKGYRFIFWLFLTGVLAVILFYFLRGCERQETAGLNESPPQIFPEVSILERSKEKSAEQKRIRFIIDSVTATIQKRQVIEKHYYHTYIQADQKAEADYYAGLIECDSVITLKNRSIAAGKVLLDRCDSLRENDAVVRATYQTELADKDADMQKLAKELFKVRNKKPPWKVYATVSGSKYPDDANAGIGAIVATPKGILVGYSKGVIHNTHDVTVGFPLGFK